MPQKILIVEDEASIRNTLKDILEYEGYEIDFAVDGEEGFLKMKEKNYNLILSDIIMPKMEGMQLLQKAKEEGIESQFVMISGHGNIDTAVEALKLGAFDFISKPPDLNRLLVTVKNALEQKSLISQTQNLKAKVYKNNNIIGVSEEIKQVLNTIEKVAPTDARVLITGENGVGKELVARMLHERSTRNNLGIIEVNCAAIPSELIESELFGHEKGAFTSSIKQRIGKFEEADNSTLFLDEIGDMSLEAQAKVLRALQEGKITRVGGNKDIKVNVRVIAATNKNLLEEVENKKFRLDLYHRLCVINIHVPPLRNRQEDIPILVNHFMDNISKEYGMKPKSLDKDVMKKLQNLSWTGNVRELRNIVERMIILGDENITKNNIDKFIPQG